MALCRGSSCGFPWKTLTLFLFVSIVCIVNEDSRQKGSFKASRTGIFLADVGLFEHAVRTYEVYERGQRWAVDNVPLYFNKTRDVVVPACVKVSGWASEAGAAVKKTTPTVLDKVKTSFTLVNL